MKSYIVTHHHDNFHFADPVESLYTRYTISAESPYEAAVLAHGMYNGYSLEQMTPGHPDTTPYRTIREQLEDVVKASPVGKNTEEYSVYHYDRIAGHVIIVELGVEVL